MTDPFTVTVASRAYCRRTGKKDRSWRDGVERDHYKPASRPDIFIAFDTEAATGATRGMPGFGAPQWGWQTQSLLFGVARIGAVAGIRVTDEIIFYPDDLPAHGVEILRRYFQERTIPLGPERPASPEGYAVRAPEQESRTAGPRHIWRDEPSVTAWLLPLSEFLKEFYRVAYLRRALVIGFNLPFDFGRLAWQWNASKSRRSVNGWSLTLWSYLDKSTGKRKRDTYKPYITIKKTGPHRAFISFNGRGRENGMPIARYRGEFLDLHTLAFALTNRPYSLASACKTFCGKDLDKDVEHGIIMVDYIEYGRHDVDATVKLAGALLDIFDHHPVSRAKDGKLPETKTYSPASLAKAYLDAAGFKAPTVPDDRLGPSFAAFYGGWTEVAIRGRVPVVLLDFKKMYQTVFILQRIQELLASKKLAFIDDTESVRRFVDTITLDMLFDKSVWPKLRVLCWISPAGEIFQTTARFPGQKIFTSGMVPRYSDKPVPYFLADVVLAKLLSGRAPKIVRAERIIGKGRQALRKIDMPGGGTFDPATDDFFKFNVEYGARMKRGDGVDLPQTITDALISGIKCVGNTGAYGIYAETNEDDLPGGETEKVDLLSDEIVLPRVRVAHPESPGRFCCPPLAGLITAGARLLLGMAHREVLGRGGNIAFGDTDSLAIVATETGKLFASVNLYRANPLSWQEVGEIVDRFSALNPYDPRLISGSILEIKAGGNVQLTDLALSSKRYCLTLPDGSFPSDDARKESVLGMLLSPLAGAPGDDRQEASHRWIDEAWRVIGRVWDGETPSDPWLALPAVRRIANSTPEINRKNLRPLNRDFAGEPSPLAEQCRPFNFFLAATAVNADGETRPVLAPFERDPGKWSGLDWRDAKTGEVVAIGDAGGWRLKTVGEFLKNYVAHRSPEWIDATGLPCGPNSRGVMQRMPIRDGERWLRTKESLTWSDDPAHAFETPGPAEFCLDDHIGDNRETFWRETLLPAIRALGAAPVAREMRIDPCTVQRWLYGKQRPSREEMARLGRILFSIAVDAGLFTDSESGDAAGFQPERIDYAAMIALIPKRIAALREFVMGSAAGLVEAYGGRRPLAAAMTKAGPKFATSEHTIRGWLCDKTLSWDVETLNSIIDKLARFCRRAASEPALRPASLQSVKLPAAPRLGDAPGERRAVVSWFVEILSRRIAA